MKQEILQKIEKVRKGEIPEGYKETEIGIYPREWNKVLFSDLFTFEGGYPASWADLGEKGIPYLHYGLIHKSKKSYIDVDKEYDELPKLEIDLENVPEKNIIPNGAVIFVDASEDYEGVSNALTIINENETPFINGLHTIVGKRKNGELQIKYSQYFLKAWGVRKQIMFYAQGVKVLGINKHNLNKIICYLPPNKEQEKIASILSELDKSIELKEKLIVEKKEFMKGLMQNSLTGKKRFSGFTKDWKEIKLKKLLNEISKRKNGNNVNRILSVNNKKGFINQNEQFGKQVASADVSNYKIIKKGQFAYNPSRINVGSIDLLENFEAGILSPMYVVFETKKELNSEYFKFWLDTHEFKGRMKGYISGSVRDSLGFKDMCAMTIKLPSIEEQSKIAEFLNIVKKDIFDLKKELKKSKEQKKGLMQLLLTGIVRVKTGGENNAC